MAIQRFGIGPIMSKRVEYNDLVFLAGLTADDQTAPVKSQTEQVLAKIDALLAEAGTDKSKILQATVYLADMKLKGAMNEAWKAWVDARNPPARVCVGVALEGNVLVEIIVIAAK